MFRVSGLGSRGLETLSYNPCRMLIDPVREPLSADGAVEGCGQRTYNP